jgi:hypothetical protein
MHVHTNQINSNAQLDALYAAERAAGKREADRTREKLSEFASKLAGEIDSAEACVVRPGTDEESQGQTKRRNQQRKDNLTEQEEQADSQRADNSISDWV